MLSSEVWYLHLYLWSLQCFNFRLSIRLYNCLRFLGVLLGLMIQIDNGFRYCCFKFLDGEPIFGGAMSVGILCITIFRSILDRFLSLTICTYRGAGKSDSRLSKHWPQLLAETIFLTDLLNKQMVFF